MCWVSEKLKIKTAKKDVAVWKVVFFDKIKRIHVSPFENYQYVTGLINRVDVTFQANDYNDNIRGYEGFHSFSSKVYYNYLTDSYNGTVRAHKKCIFIKDRLICTFRGKENFSLAIARGRLPKGAKYATNKNGEIISSSIVIDNFIDL